MITCSLTYQIDPAKVAEFEVYSKAWIHLVTKLGGTHHGYWLPHEGPNDVAYCHFSFPSLAAYEEYRGKMDQDADCQAVYQYAKDTNCIIRFDRSFTRPVIDGAPLGDLL